MLIWTVFDNSRAIILKCLSDLAGYWDSMTPSLMKIRIQRGHNSGRQQQSSSVTGDLVFKQVFKKEN